MIIEESEHGPFKKFFELGYDSAKYAKSMLDPWNEPTPLMFKLTHEPRAKLLELLQSGYPISRFSIYQQYLNTEK